MAKRVLIVDDEPDVVKFIGIRIKQAGYETLSAYDGQQCLDMVKKEKPDLIILDLMLPKVDGYKVCGMLKHDGRYKDIPVIMLTALGSDTDKKLGYECGADAFITKPYQHEEVAAKIKELLKE